MWTELYRSRVGSSEAQDRSIACSVTGDPAGAVRFGGPKRTRTQPKLYCSRAHSVARTLPRLYCFWSMQRTTPTMQCCRLCMCVRPAPLGACTIARETRRLYRSVGIVPSCSPFESPYKLRDCPNLGPTKLLKCGRDQAIVVP
eukprot:jgi/Botrbrau1/14474/Bobra.0014s0112.2